MFIDEDNDYFQIQSVTACTSYKECAMAAARMSASVFWYFPTDRRCQLFNVTGSSGSITTIDPDPNMYFSG